MARALVIGGGLVGCATALRLTQRGFAVEVVERAERDAASAAAAGILGAQLESHAGPVLSSLCVASRALYPAFVAELEELAGVTLEHDVCGSLRLGYDDADLERLAAIVAGQRARGLDAELWDASRLAREEPALAPCAGAACFAGDGVVDPPRLLEAARAAVERAGAVWTRGLVRDVILSDGRCRGAVLDEGSTLAADEVIVCAGSWSGTLQPLPIEPVRGQLFELRLPAPPIRRVVEGDEAYLSRRADGRVLVGSTEERVGFERAVTAAAAARLLPAALRMVPALGAAQLTGSWCGFRAGTPDTLPILGRAAPGLVLATGHFRNGIVLAPITGAIVAAICTGEPPPVDLAPFDVRRFGGPNGHVS